MVLTYSPHRDGGGTLQLLSPTHIHQSDPNSTIEQLRRSLSRSPSRGPTFRLVTSKSTSTSPSPNSPLSPSPLSPQARPGLSKLSSNGSSLIPFPLSAKSKPGTRRSSPMRASHRSLSAQRSPVKRALSDSTDNGNATPQSLTGSSDGVENEGGHNRTPEEKSDLRSFGPSSYAEPSEPFPAPRPMQIRRERPISFFDLGAKSSPLKRSEGGMNLELAQLGSPSPKRRSMHGAPFGPDFNIFDQAATGLDKSSTESSVGELLGSDTSPHIEHFSAGFSPVPKRSGSLRKTTMQQRYEKPQFGRPRPAFESSSDVQTPGVAGSKTRQRLSLDNVLPAPTRDSPFSSQGSLPNASMHPVVYPAKDMLSFDNTSQYQRHPLSRTMTQSSSNSSLAEDSPTHIPARHGVFKRPAVDFSKTLPMGALGPPSNEPSTTESSQGSSFETPDSYKLAKPLPAAFMSTGLISKRNRNIQKEQMDFKGSVGPMPDTPCKRPVSMMPIMPMPTPGMIPSKPRQSRHSSHSFGTPSTPFNPHNSRPLFGGLGKGTSIFGSNFNGGNNSRRGSFLSTDGEENSKSPMNFQSQSSNDTDVPPTPTKRVNATYNVHSRLEFGQQLNQQSPQRPEDGGAGFESPRAEFNSSPIFNRLTESPHTPSESMVPPDPSGLSISARADKVSIPFGDSTGLSSSLFLPTTPTATRDSFARSSKFGASVTPVHGSARVEVDTSISSRFDKVESIGNGQFSMVFKVSLRPDPASSRGYFIDPVTHASPKTPSTGKVWAVKKSSRQYIGQRDRKRKLQEVDILKRLGQSNHCIGLVDYWEEKGHLYIQTEFCAEGSLDQFLAKAGQDARLDDFRIWKILLEMSLGLKHVHDSGVIHLDIKPANVLIASNGVLKIADFGMATLWPVEGEIEGEGDREYMGPEILMGKFDKPGDIFAFGLVILEIAANVMLPDNGASWQRLRNGDMSDVPSLTLNSKEDIIPRDSMGKPITPAAFDDFDTSDNEKNDFGGFDFGFKTKPVKSKESAARKLEMLGAGELQSPPEFMINASHEESLDKIVRWMISPELSDRPTVDQLLRTMGVKWTETRRRCGATIYEGHWGPADAILQDDAEMIDV